MTRTQLMLCATAFSAVVYLPGVSSRAADDQGRDGRSIAQIVHPAPAVGGPVQARGRASRPGAPERPDGVTRRETAAR